MQTVGRFGVGLEREMVPPRGWWYHHPFPQEATVYIVLSLAGLWACGYLQVWDPSPDLGSRARVLGGGLLEARPLTFLTPACLPCPLSAQSFSVCSMTLFVCLQVPQAEEAPMGVTGLGGCQWREVSQLCQFPPTASPLPWGPLDTPPHSLHPRTPEVQSSKATPGPYRPLLVASVLGVQGRKQNIPPSGRAQ